MPPALADYTTLRLGGPAGRLVEAADEAEIVAAVRAADEAGTPLLVLAGGSYLVVADAAVMPSNLGVNPQHTIMGLGMRFAEQLVA